MNPPKRPASRLLACLASLTAAACPIHAGPPRSAAAEPRNADGPAEWVGINEAGPTYYNPEVRLANLARRTGGWISRRKGSKQWTDGRRIEVDRLGYPVRLADDQLAVALVTTHNGGNTPTGRYRLRWRGAGRVDLGHRPLRVVARRDRETLYEIKATSPNGLYLTVSGVSASDPLRDVSLTALDSDTRGYFATAFLKDVSRFDVIRLMPVARTTGSRERDWSDRATTHAMGWFKSGRPTCGRLGGERSKTTSRKPGRPRCSSSPSDGRTSCPAAPPVATPATPPRGGRG